MNHESLVCNSQKSEDVSQVVANNDRPRHLFHRHCQSLPLNHQNLSMVDIKYQRILPVGNIWQTSKPPKEQRFSNKFKVMMNVVVLHYCYDMMKKLKASFVLLEQQSLTVLHLWEAQSFGIIGILTRSSILWPLANFKLRPARKERNCSSDKNPNKNFIISGFGIWKRKLPWYWWRLSVGWFFWENLI